jgi:DNA-binding CsgD family transcriptional regulator/PAS domain-containing protein
MGLSELSTARFIEISSSAAELLDTTVEDAVGLSYLAIVEPESAAAESFRLARAGVIDGTQTRRRLRRRDGSTVDVQATGWVIRSAFGPDLGLWMAVEVNATQRDTVALEIVAPALPVQAHTAVDGPRVTVDDHWRFVATLPASSETTSLLGRRSAELLGGSLLDLVHPSDLASLVFALARATTDRSARTVVRLLHHDQTWRPVRVSPTILDGDDGAPLVSFVLSGAAVGTAEHGSEVRDIPGSLRRIADRIEAAGFVPALADMADVADGLGLASVTDLSPRQWEIVGRLVRGERVPTIAAEMYLSRSTIRNHLSAIFAKVGVHSQEELLTLGRGVARRNVPVADDVVPS